MPLTSCFENVSMYPIVGAFGNVNIMEMFGFWYNIKTEILDFSHDATVTLLILRVFSYLVCCADSCLTRVRH